MDKRLNKLLYGVAYYDEYMPYERLEQDIELMKKANINLVRIAESTWSTLEPEDGVFNFYHIDRVLQAMEKAGIQVIVGTPTYAIPSWMEKKHPDILATTHHGRRLYGARQIMDITNEHYLFYCERVIRTLMEHVKDSPCVIGYQIDNETKHYGTAGENVQAAFRSYLMEKFNGDIEKMNDAFGFHYWSNALHSWDDLPDVRGTINGSFGGEFERFQRKLVTDFLQWQANLVNEYKRPDQFITHNFDFGWKGGSYGVQPDVNHFEASRCLDIAGCDIYHPTQKHLTGAEIAFCGDLTRSLKQDNYLVLETEAQGFPEWMPLDGQLFLQAFSHLASGADCVEYWHWHSLHNACETYWKGLLSHDFQENKTYREAVQTGREMRRLSDRLIHMKKENKIAIMVSNEALTGLKWFPICRDYSYNEVVRWLYDALYELNLECDIISAEAENLEKYDMLLLPALYCVSEKNLQKIRNYAEQGGCLVATFKTAFCNEEMKVYPDLQPHSLTDCFGIHYHHFTYAEDTGLAIESPALSGAEANCGYPAIGFMECLEPDSAQILLRYRHDNWGQYAAAVKNQYGKGTCYYLGCMFEKALLKDILREAAAEKGIQPELGQAGFPLIVRSGKNQFGRKLHYLLNYSSETQRVSCPVGSWTELFSGQKLQGNDMIELGKWDVRILEELPEA